ARLVMQPVDVLGDDGVEQVPALELGEGTVGFVRPLVPEHLEPRPVEAPELRGVAAEAIDVRDLHRVHLLPKPLPRAPAARYPPRQGDARAGQREGRPALIDQLGETFRPVGCYLPCHFGLRLPRNAEMPSFASSEKKAVAKPCFSASIPSS